MIWLWPGAGAGERDMRVMACVTAAVATLGLGEARAMSAIRLTSPAIGADARIPETMSRYGANRSPPLAWTPVAAARSYAIILDDPDASDPRPFVHWLIWNIPGGVSALPEALPTEARLAQPPGAVQGTNGAESVGYYGPHPPSGLHHYQFHIFALDTRLGLAPGANREALAGAMNNHVLGVGEMVATFPAPGGR
jgi:Raf kinase inhibitor-like YbhB/YbcL family protein